MATTLTTPTLTDTQRAALAALLALPRNAGRSIVVDEDSDATCTSLDGIDGIDGMVLLADVNAALWPDEDCPDPPDVAAGHEWHE